MSTTIDELISKEEYARILSVVEQSLTPLAFRTASAVWLQGLSLKEASIRLGVGTRTISNRLYEARKVCQKALGEYNPKYFSEIPPTETRDAQFSRLKSEGLSNAEIALDLGISKKTVQNAFARLKKRKCI